MPHVYVADMTNPTELHPDELLLRAIKSLPGWYGHLEDASDFSGRSAGARTIGAIISSILLAAGEEEPPVAVNGRVEDTGHGYLYVVYPDFMVTVVASRLRENNASYETRLRFFADARDLRVQTKHSYYDGTDTYPRHRGFTFSFTIDGERLELAPSHWSPAGNELVRDDAVYAAFEAVRSWMVRR